MNKGIIIVTCGATKLIVFHSSKELFGPLFIKKGNRNIYSTTWKTSKWWGSEAKWGEKCLTFSNCAFYCAIN